MTGTHVLRLTLSALFLGSTMPWLVGCTTTGYQQAGKTANSMASTRDELLHTRQQIARTVGSLDKLVNDPGEDLRPEYIEFEKDIKTTKSFAKRVQSRANWMQKQGASYFAGWADEISSISNPDLQAQSDWRRKESIISWSNINLAMQEAADAYEPLLADLEDLQSALKQDLTAAGLEAVSGQVSATKRDAQALQKKINSVIMEIQRVTQEIAPTPGT